MHITHYKTKIKYTDEEISPIIEWVDYIIEDLPIAQSLTKQLSKRELTIIDKKKYYRKVRQLSNLVNREAIIGYNKDNLLTSVEVRNGWNFVKNSNKLVVDHKISIIYGFKNNIPVEDIAHISNLRYIPSCENQAKLDTVFVDSFNEWILSKQKNIL
jgi:hypothetical protein